MVIYINICKLYVYIYSKNSLHTDKLPREGEEPFFVKASPVEKRWHDVLAKWKKNVKTASAVKEPYGTRVQTKILHLDNRFASIILAIFSKFSKTSSLLTK